jgi:hypothetical protein
MEWPEWSFSKDRESLTVKMKHRAFMFLSAEWSSVSMEKSGGKTG